MRKVFDTIPEQFDKYRSRYCEELFAKLITYAGLSPAKSVLELGPGTGQATEPILNTGCDYNAIELGAQKFDLIYSAATIQWIPEEVAFGKTFELLKPGGILAMMLLHGDYKTPNEELYNKIQQVYDQYFKPETVYTHGSFRYASATNYGYTDFEKHEFYGKREFTADEYVAYCGTHCDHIVIPEPYKSKFFDGLREVVLEAGNKLVANETYILYLAKKPL